MGTVSIEVPVGQEPATSQVLAREIMGKNIFGIEEAVRHLGVIPKKRELAYLEEIPFSEEELELRSKTHILAAVFPMSLIEIRRAARSKRQGTFDPQWWYDKRPFALRGGRVGWRLIRKDSVPGVFEKAWVGKLSLLPYGEVVPTTRVMSYAVTGHYLATGERLFVKCGVCCADDDTKNNHVYIEHLSNGGLFIGIKDDTTSERFLGLASEMSR